jgi:hypothetical protein
LSGFADQSSNRDIVDPAEMSVSDGNKRQGTIMPRARWIPLLFYASVLPSLTACVSTSDVLDVGRDTYSVSATADGYRTAASARQSAFQTGASKCAADRKHFALLNESTAATRMGIDTTVNVTFRCLSDDGPAFAR